MLLKNKTFFFLLTFLITVLCFCLSANSQDRSALKSEIFCKTAQYLSKDAQKKHDYTGCYPILTEKNIKDLPDKSRELLEKWRVKASEKNITANELAEEIFTQLEKGRKKRLSEEAYLSFKTTVNSLLSNFSYQPADLHTPPIDSMALLRMQVLALKLESEKSAQIAQENLKKTEENIRSEFEFYVWLLLLLLILCFAMIFVKGRQQSKRISAMEAHLKRLIDEKNEIAEEKNEN